MLQILWEGSHAQNLNPPTFLVVAAVCFWSSLVSFPGNPTNLSPENELSDETRKVKRCCLSSDATAHFLQTRSFREAFKILKSTINETNASDSLANIIHEPL
jgi:hypothetical protein